ncbi:MAG: HNH endonuclease [Anaerolineaceae bacterium]
MKRCAAILALAVLCVAACFQPNAAAPAVSDGSPTDVTAAAPTVGVAPPAPGTRTPGINYPDPVRTPGEAFAVGLDVICVKGYTKGVRDVSIATKNRIYADYGITRVRMPNEFEMDHLIPLALGGSNSDRNLWPEPAEPNPGFHQKDQLEVKLAQLACDGKLPLAEAQRAIAEDWYAAYRRYVLGQ